MNGKVYIGQTIRTLIERWGQHVEWAESEAKTQIPFILAIRKYGKNAFKIEEICYAETKDELDFLEVLFIIVFKSTDPNFGYNLRDGGSRGAHSEISRRRISDAHRGKPGPPQERRDRIASSVKLFWSNSSPEYKENRIRRDWHHTEEAKQAISNNIWITNGIENKKAEKEEQIPLGWRLGRVHSSHWKTGRKKGSKNINGTKVTTIWITDGTISRRYPKDQSIPDGCVHGRLITWAKGREAGFKNPHTSEWNSKIGKALTGIKRSAETKKKNALVNIGRKQSGQTVARRLAGSARTYVYREGFYGS